MNTSQPTESQIHTRNRFSIGLGETSRYCYETYGHRHPLPVRPSGARGLLGMEGAGVEGLQRMDVQGALYRDEARPHEACPHEIGERGDECNAAVGPFAAPRYRSKPKRSFSSRISVSAWGSANPFPRATSTSGPRRGHPEANSIVKKKSELPPSSGRKILFSAAGTKASSRVEINSCFRNSVMVRTGRILIPKADRVS